MTIPPSDAAIGRDAARHEASRPTVSSRFISSPTTRKKNVRSPWFTHSPIGSANSPPPSRNPSGVFHHAWNADPSGEFVSAVASAVAARRSRPVEGAQPAKSTVAVWSRCPSEPSSASASALSSHAPS